MPTAETSASRVQDELREAILTGALEPGARLRAEALAKQLRSSRTPVREALLLLAQEGLVQIEPRRGATVRSFDAADLYDLYEVRALIEPYAAALAAQRISDGEITRLTEIRARSTACDASDDQRAQSLSCHRELVGAIARRRAELAATVMQMHIQGAGAFLAEVMAGER